MKLAFTFSLVLILLLTSTSTFSKSSKNILSRKAGESFLMTFECNSCTKRNKFYISGPEEHTFKAVEFPLQVKLKSGAYEMTYWQNRVRQIHLPFDVGANLENRIIVKD